MVWVVLASLEGAIYPELARTPVANPRFRALMTQASEALLLIVLPIALGLAAGAWWLTPWIYGPWWRTTRPGTRGRCCRVLSTAVARRHAVATRWWSTIR